MTANLLTNKRQQNLRPNEVTDNKEDVHLLWLDENMNDSADYRRIQLLLLEINPTAQFYSKFDRCFDLIKVINDEPIFLIVSNDCAQRVLAQTSTYQTLAAIFIFSINHQDHEPLMEEHQHFTEIFTDPDSLLKSIRDKINLIQNQTLAFSLFDQKQTSLKDLSQESASFLLHQMLIFVLKQIPQDKQSKQHMLDFCRDYYKNNKHKLKKIEEFEQNYNCEKAIEWYTNERFLNKLLNKALHADDIEILCIFRSFIIELCAAIEHDSEDIREQGTVTLYRKTQIPKEDLDKLKENVGKIISTNGFLSTSRNIDMSPQFIHPSFIMNNFQLVLFDIQADPSIKSVSFADVKKKSRRNSEEEVLFNLNSLFKIHSVNFDPTHDLWKVQLHATDEGLERVEEYLTLSKIEMEEPTAIINFGYLLLYELDDVDQSETYFNILLESLPADHPDIASVYNNIGNMHNQRDEWDLALKNFEIGYDIRRKCLPPDHIHISASLNNLGMIHKAKENDSLALDYFQRSLSATEKRPSTENIQTAIVLENIGKVYSNKHDYDTALIYLLRALEIFKRIQPEQHRDTARCLGTIGYVYEKRGDFRRALDYYRQQLNMEEQCLPYDHPNLINHLGWIVDTYKKMGKTKKALEFSRAKLNIHKNRLGANHSCIARILMIVADVLKDINRNEALKYYEEALSTLEKSTPPHHQTYSECLTYMSSLYSEYGMSNDALRCELKVLNLYRRRLSSDHTDIAYSLRNVARYYETMNNSLEALLYFNESLSLYRANYGLDHEDVKRGEEDIAVLNDKPISSTPTKTERKDMKEESYVDPISTTSQQTLSADCLTTESKSNSLNTSSRLSPFFKIKTCTIL